MLVDEVQSVCDAKAIATATPERGLLAEGRKAPERHRRRDQQSTHLLEHERPSCRITALVVQPHVRRSGAGTAPLDAAEAEARRLGCFRLEVTCRPTAARRTASTRAACSASGRAGSSRSSAEKGAQSTT
jgi:GNAT superfamily N-acetyltransferase